MIYSELQRLVNLEEQLKEKYGNSVLNKNTHKLIGWYEVVAIIRFGSEWKTHPDFLKEVNSMGHVNPDIFKIKEDIIKGNIPSWIMVVPQT